MTWDKTVVQKEPRLHPSRVIEGSPEGEAVAFVYRLFLEDHPEGGDFDQLAVWLVEKGFLPNLFNVYQQRLAQAAELAQGMETIPDAVPVMSPLAQARQVKKEEAENPKTYNFTAFNALKTFEGVLFVLGLALFMLVIDWFTNLWFVLNISFGYIPLGDVLLKGDLIYVLTAVFLMGSEWYLRVVDFFEGLTEGAETTVKRIVHITRLAVYLMIGLDAAATIMPPIQFFTQGFDFLGETPAAAGNWFGLLTGLIVGIVLAGLTWLATAKFPEILLTAIGLWRQRRKMNRS